MNWLGDASTTVMAALLLGAYGIDVAAVDEAVLPADGAGGSPRWRIIADDKPFDVAFCRPGRKAVRAALAADVQEHCRAQGLPVPQVVADREGRLVSPTDDGVYVVTVPPAGVRMPSPMPAVTARSAGTVLGLLHSVLAGYPVPRPEPEPACSAWLSAPLEELAETVHADRRRAGKDATIGDRGRLRELADRRVAAMRTHLAPGRRRVPARPTAHVVHGAFTPENLTTSGSTVTGITGFRAPVGYPAVELAAFAFDPRTVAGADDWAGTALAVVEAYRANNPYLPMAEIAVLADIAVLILLSSTPWHPDGPVAAWESTDAALSRITGHLDRLRTVLSRMSGAQE